MVYSFVIFVLWEGAIFTLSESVKGLRSSALATQTDFENGIARYAKARVR
jgi:hypothetical protein